MIAQAGSTLPWAVRYTTSTYNEIPAMTDPLGAHWRQPADIREAEMDETHVMLTDAQVSGLMEYNHSYPSGCYDGKCWRREGDGFWYLCWYHPHPVEGKIGIGSRIIIEI